jgi:hypothetical protein
MDHFVTCWSHTHTHILLQWIRKDRGKFTAKIRRQVKGDRVWSEGTHWWNVCECNPQVFMTVVKSSIQLAVSEAGTHPTSRNFRPFMEPEGYFPVEENFLLDMALSHLTPLHIIRPCLFKLYQSSICAYVSQIVCCKQFSSPHALHVPHISSLTRAPY